jgi:aspartate oxidase
MGACANSLLLLPASTMPRCTLTALLFDASGLAGNSLAECVVFGRIAGKSAASHVSLAAGKVQHAPAVPMTQAITSQM